MENLHQIGHTYIPFRCKHTFVYTHAFHFVMYVYYYSIETYIFNQIISIYINTYTDTCTHGHVYIYTYTHNTCIHIYINVYLCLSIHTIFFLLDWNEHSSMVHNNEMNYELNTRFYMREVSKENRYIS